MRRSGIAAIGSVPWGTHFCQFYQTPQDLIDVLVPYFQQGLADNELCLWVTAGRLGVSEAAAALRAAVPDLDDRRQRGQIAILDYREWYTPSGRFDADAVLAGWVARAVSARARGFDGLRLSGNTFWLEKSDWRSFSAYEATVNDVIGQHPMIALCSYSIEQCGAFEVIDVVRNHQFALIKQAGQWHLIESRQQRKTEQALAESEERYRGLFETCRDGVASADMEGRILTANPAACALLGYTEAELRQFTYPELTPARWRDRDARIVSEQVVPRGYSDEFEKELLRKDGSPCPVNLRVWLFRGPDGRPAGMWALIRDITESQRAGQERDATIEFLRLVNRSTGTQELVRTALGFFRRLVGCEALGLRLRDGDDYPYYEAHGFDSRFACAAGRLCARGPRGAVRRDAAGEPVLQCLCGRVISGRHDPSRSCFTARGSFWTDRLSGLPAAPGGDDLLSDAFDLCRAEGYESLALVPLSVGPLRLGLLQLVDRRRARFTPEAIGLWERLADHLAVALARFRAEEELQGANERLEGRVAERTQALAETVRTLREEARERQRAQAALRQAHQQLARRAERLRALAGELTLAEHRERRRLARLLHDHLQQLLVGAKFRAAALGRVADPAVRSGLAEIEELLGESIQASRDLTAELSPPILHEGGLVAGLEWLARWMRARHGLAVEVVCGRDAEPAAEEVKILLFEAVRELLFNVVKHAAVPEARVGLERIGANRIRVVVSDRGAGFDPAAARPAGEPGAGFGLFSIRERLERLGGRMTIESAPGRGCRLALTVPAPAPAPAPRRPAHAAVPAAPARRPHPESAGGARRARRRGRIRILLVDDHAVMRQALARLLAGEPDVEVVGEAADGRQAVDMALKLHPAVVVMDLDMPGMDGVEATRRIRFAAPAVQVIALSMLEAADWRATLRSAGAAAFLTKSGPVDAVVTAIRRCAGAPAPARPPARPPAGRTPRPGRRAPRRRR